MDGQPIDSGRGGHRTHPIVRAPPPYTPTCTALRLLCACTRHSFTTRFLVGVKLPDKAELSKYTPATARPPMWWLVDLLLVAVHLLMCVLPPIPVIALIVWMQTVYAVRCGRR